MQKVCLNRNALLERASFRCLTTSNEPEAAVASLPATIPAFAPSPDDSRPLSYDDCAHTSLKAANSS